jgi:hypothetical protein
MKKIFLSFISTFAFFISASPLINETTSSITTNEIDLCDVKAGENLSGKTITFDTSIDFVQLFLNGIKSIDASYGDVFIPFSYDTLSFKASLICVSEDLSIYGIGYASLLTMNFVKPYYYFNNTWENNIFQLPNNSSVLGIYSKMGNVEISKDYSILDS